jgi:hypothetical protein
MHRSCLSMPGVADLPVPSLYRKAWLQRIRAEIGRFSSRPVARLRLGELQTRSSAYRRPEKRSTGRSSQSAPGQLVRSTTLEARGRETPTRAMDRCQHLPSSALLQIPSKIQSNAALRKRYPAARSITSGDAVHAVPYPTLGWLVWIREAGLRDHSQCRDIETSDQVMMSAPH